MESLVAEVEKNVDGNRVTVEGEDDTLEPEGAEKATTKPADLS